MPLFAQQRCARFYPAVYHIIPKKTSRPGGGGLQIQEILMLRLVFFACLHQRGERALHPFLHGGHSLRVPLQPQKALSPMLVTPSGIVTLVRLLQP